MSVRQVTKWEASDGTLHDSHQAAADHDERQDLIEYLSDEVDFERVNVGDLADVFLAWRDRRRVEVA